MIIENRDRYSLSAIAALYVVYIQLFFVAGCNPPRENLEKFNNLYQQGDYLRASQFSTNKIDKDLKPEGDNLLWMLQLAATERAEKKYQLSTDHFDQAEEMMKVYDLQLRQTDVLGTTLVNDNVIPYRGTTYDAIMVNTYKALNFMALGRDDLARVEFNRITERQTRAKERFNQEIQKEKERLDKANSEKKVDYSKTAENQEVKDKIRQTYPGLYEFEAYPDYVNPFSTYVAGVFFMIIGDMSKSRDFLKESAGMLPGNVFVQRDFEYVDNWMVSSSAPKPKVWVFFENGLGSVKEEFRVDLPLFLFTGKMYYTGIALPKLVQRWAASERLNIESSGTNYETEIVSDMDRVIQTEFSKEYPWILTRAFLSAGAKTAAQYIMLEQENDNNSTTVQVAAIVTAIYSVVTTVADVRIWSALPKNFQAACVPMPEDGRIIIHTTQGNAYPISIRPCRYAIVYIKMVSAMSEPMIEIITY